MQKKFLRPRNIILIVLMICCLGGCGIVSSTKNKAESSYMQRVDSLQMLTTTAQILDAVKNPQPKLYVINGYQFPKYELVGDPNHILADGYLYISVSVSEKGNDGKYHDNPNLGDTKYGRLFFDEQTELLDFNKATVSTAGAATKRSRSGYEYNYGLIAPDAKLSFVAELGGNSAKVSGFDGNKNIVEGTKESLASKTKDSTLFLLYNIILGIAFGLMGLFVFADYLTIKEKEQKRLERQRSKAGNKKQ